MFKKKLDEKTYGEIYNYVKKICKEMGLSEDIGIMVNRSKYMTGFVNSSKYIEISKSLLDIYNTKPFVTYLVIAHELVHLKHKDHSIRRAWWTFILTKNSCLKILLQESRADIEGAYYSKLSNEEITEAHVILKEHNERIYKSTEYREGYASRERRAYYSCKYKEFSEEAKREVISDYCKAKGIQDPENFFNF